MQIYIYLQMIFSFIKYQGTGNDFVIIDNRGYQFPINDHSSIAKICNRNYGIGSDGLILIEPSKDSDFFMRYFNADGYEGSLCGNGSRCAVHYANKLGMCSDQVNFIAADGLHQASIIGNQISLSISSVINWKTRGNDIFLDTGSPHHVVFSKELSQVNVESEGAIIANCEPYIENGTNVNFVSVLDDSTLAVRTYERGVEAETLSCGTGVTASAIAAHITGVLNTTKISIKTKGGELSVSFMSSKEEYYNIILNGPVVQVFSGKWEIDKT
jgi:diaminopimelate epimerase